METKLVASDQTMVKDISENMLNNTCSNDDIIFDGSLFHDIKNSEILYV